MPLGAFKAALLGSSGGGSKTYWALALSPNTDGDESNGFGLAVDSSDNVYWALYDNSGYEGHLVKFEQSGGLPTVDVAKKLDNYVPVSGLTVWDDSGTETLACYGTRNATSESCWIYSIGTDLTTSINSGRSTGIYINSGDNAGMGSNCAELDTSNGKLFWSAQDNYNYFGWASISQGIWFENGYSASQTGSGTYSAGSGKTNDSNLHYKHSAFQWGANRTGCTTRYNDTPVIVGNHSTSGQTATGTAYELWAQGESNIYQCSSSAAWNPGETDDDYLYMLILNPYVWSPYERVSLVKVNDSYTTQWCRTLSGDNMYSPGTTGSNSMGGGQPCKPIFDSSNNCYIAWGDAVGSGGTERVSIVKFNSSGTLQWQNSIEATTVAGVTNQFNPQQLALSDDEEDLYVSINRCRLSGSSGTGLVLKVPSDGSMTSSSSISLNSGAITYNSSSYTDVAGNWNFATGTTMGYATSTSQTGAGSGTWGTGSSFTTHLHTAEIEG